MILRFNFGGSLIYEGPSDCIPPAGSEVHFITQGSTGGIQTGTLARANVDGDIAAVYDFANGEEVEVTIAVRGVRPIPV